MIYLYIGLALYSLFYGTWIFYTAFMHIKKYKDILKTNLPVIWYGLAPIFIIGLLMDILFNFIWGTIYYREIPRELLFTARCSRHMKGSGIQLARATRVCKYLLNPFDEGHCD